MRYVFLVLASVLTFACLAQPDKNPYKVLDCSNTIDENGLPGSGTFYCDGERSTFKGGYFLFVPAFIEHRFENFTEDFSTWFFFYGPKGGESCV